MAASRQASPEPGSSSAQPHAPPAGFRELEALPDLEARAAPPAGARRFALFPVENLTGGVVPVSEVKQALEAALRARGLDLVRGAEVESFLARHRVRYTGGLDRETAVFARDELGATGVILASVGLYQVGENPKLSLTARLVSADDPPAIEWIGGTARAGDDSTGLLGLGFVSTIQALEELSAKELTGSLSAFLGGRGPRTLACEGSRWLRPRFTYRADGLVAGPRYKVAVLPFVNLTARRHAGEAVALDFVRQLEAAGGFEVTEPGRVRDELLKYRIILEGGVSLDQARIVLETLDSDLVLAGTVNGYSDSTGAPRLSFSAYLLNREDNEVVWESSAYNQGDDGVFVFDLGRVSTVAGMACRIAKNMVDEMLGKPIEAPAQKRTFKGDT